MQFFEIAFCIFTVLILLRLLVGPIPALPKLSFLLLIGLVLLGVGIMLEGYRWQMIPAYGSFCLLGLASLKTSKTHSFLKAIGTLSTGLLVTLSFLLAQQLPIITLPEPVGPYAVGTFNYSVIDESRIERFSPNKKRELYIQVWYPAEKSRINDYPVRTMWQEMYNGQFDLFSFFSGYLKHIKTHSHIEIPIAAGEQFPILLFNHGLFLLAEQNTVLMEHLASNGYVIFSIARPYESAKVNLAHAGSITATSQLPDDVGITVEVKNEGELVFNNILDKDNLTFYLMAINELLVDFSAAPDQKRKQAVISNALTQGWVSELEPQLTQRSLDGLLSYVKYNNLSIDTWVKDIQFVADSISTIDAPINDFSTSVNMEGFGVFGMSRGGAAAGEFCKIDRRCLAGGNMDGLQYGEHWNSPVGVPFLMMYSVENSGMNDFTYLPSGDKLLNYTIKNTMHADFTDLVLIMPLIHNLEMDSQVDGKRTNEIINAIQLRFFDHYLKGKQDLTRLDTEIPEIIIREHLNTSSVTIKN